MAGKAVYRKLAKQLGADAAKSLLYGDKSVNADKIPAGIDSPFKRDKQSSTKDTSVYKSDNGLTVEITKSGSYKYSKVIHTKSGKQIGELSYRNQPLSGNTKDYLAKVQSVGSKVNFNITAKALQSIGSGSKASDFQDLLWSIKRNE